MDAYNNLVDKIGDAIIDWSDPDRIFRANLEGWWLCDFRSAITIALAYVAFVVLGSQVMRALPAMDPYPIKFLYNV